MRKVMLGIFAALPLMLMAPASNAATYSSEDHWLGCFESSNYVIKNVRSGWATVCPISVPTDFLRWGTKLLEVNIKPSCLSTTPKKIGPIYLEAHGLQGELRASVKTLVGPALYMTVNTGTFGTGALWTIPTVSGPPSLQYLATVFNRDQIRMSCIQSVRVHKL